MDTHTLSFDLRSYRLRTARQKKRLQKEDKEKQLLRLYKLHEALRQQQMKLPMVPLEKPYQKGWKRIFVLRDDVARSDKAPFYRELLEKINTVQYSHEKTFKAKAKRRKLGKRVYVDREQLLKKFDTIEWTYGIRGKQILTPEEKLHFHLEETWDKHSGLIYHYVFNEPWRYRLKIVPNMIYEMRVLDTELEQEMGEVKARIAYNNLWPKILRLTRGRKQAWKQCRGEKEKNKSLFRNNAFQTKMDEYLLLNEQQ